MPGLTTVAGKVRAFNRFYTRTIGVLQPKLLDSRFSLTEARILYEIAHQDQPTSAAIADLLGLDRGYLSRTLGNLVEHGIVRRTRSATDKRESLLSLTAAGKREVARLDQLSHDAVSRQVQALSSTQRSQLMHAMGIIESLLGQGNPAAPPFVIRTHRPGDLGWIIERHGAVYHEEYGWDGKFEGLVAEVVAKFVARFDPRRERCWIAERNGERIGSIMLVNKSATVGKLRLLLVEPSARGLGLGKALVEECLSFARQTGYRKVELWTNSVLDAARHIYEQAGFTLVSEDPHQQFGHGLVGQTWEKRL